LKQRSAAYLVLVILFCLTNCSKGEEENTAEIYSAILDIVDSKKLALPYGQVGYSNNSLFWPDNLDVKFNYYSADSMLKYNNVVLQFELRNLTDSTISFITSSCFGLSELLLYDPNKCAIPLKTECDSIYPMIVSLRPDEFVRFDQNLIVLDSVEFINIGIQIALIDHPELKNDNEIWNIFADSMNFEVCWGWNNRIHYLPGED
jgi:hypothetical protein